MNPEGKEVRCPPMRHGPRVRGLLAAAGVRVLRTRWVVRAPVWLFRRRLGWLLGHRFLMLEHTGRRTGHRRYVVLEVVEHPDVDRWLVLSGFGERAQWLRNIRQNERVRVTVGRRGPIAAFARELEVGQAAGVMARYASAQPRAWAILCGILEKTSGADVGTTPVVAIVEAPS